MLFLHLMRRHSPRSTLFPTRRSSDLWDNFNYYTYIKLKEKADQSDAGIASLQDKMQAIYKKNESVLKVAFILQPLQDVHLQDRKSTRLNSSHVEISYAVFCLKKKK